jgi:hypothetical protein
MQAIEKTKLYSIIKKDLKMHDGKILLFKGEYCGGNDRCHGIFEFNSRDEPIIKVAIGNKTRDQGFGVLIHEYCHFLQWREGSQIWKEFEESNFSIDDVIKNPKKFKKEILLLIKLESDCERRVIKLIKKYDLFCPKQYAREANFILFKYAFIHTNSFWPSSPKRDNNFYEKCPDKIRKSHLSYLDIPKEVYSIFINSQP